MAQSDFYLIFSPAWLLVSFLLYWPLFYRVSKVGEARNIILIRYYGAAVFGAIPVLVTVLSGFSARNIFGLGFTLDVRPGLWVISLGIGLLLAVINYFASRSKNNLKEFPQIRDKVWTSKTFFHNILSWVVYLIGYEFLFRGILLFPLVPILGFWPTAVLGTAFYSLTHYPKSFREAIGAIPLGILLTYLAWETQSIWPCILIHICLAVSSSVFSLHHHPEINLVKKASQIDPKI